MLAGIHEWTQAALPLMGGSFLVGVCFTLFKTPQMQESWPGYLPSESPDDSHWRLAQAAKIEPAVRGAFSSEPGITMRGAGQQLACC